MQLEEPAQKLTAQGGSESPALGLSVESLTPVVARDLGLPDKHGVLVKGVQDDSPAGNAGLQAGDVIVEVDHQPVANATELRRDVDRHAKGAPLLVLVHRHGATFYAAIALS